VDEITMRLLDAMMAVPIILLYMIIMAALGASAINVVLAMTIVGTPGIARLVRSLTLDIRTREYIRAAETRGESHWYIMFTEILPNARGPIIVDAMLRVGYAIFAMGTLGISRVRHSAPISGLGLHGGQGPRVHPGGQPLGRAVAIIGYRLAGGGLEPAGRRYSRGVDALPVEIK
jgi:peptide/nickel transport system permease protein